MIRNIEMTSMLSFSHIWAGQRGQNKQKRAWRFLSINVQMPEYVIGYYVGILMFAGSLPANSQTFNSAKSFRDCPECPEMIVIPAGTFQMGLSAEEIQRLREVLNPIINHEPFTGQPQHTVTISHPFALGKYPITRGEFATFAQETGFSGRAPCIIRSGRYFGPNSSANWDHPGFVQKDRDPVVCVTWSDAQAYVDWLNAKTRSTGRGANQGPYRLPTEAEYEYAARGGTTTTRWWGDDIGKNKAVCGGCGSPWDFDHPAPVGLYGPNPFGLYDILGNVLEWTQDCWSNNYEKVPVDGSAMRGGDCGYRVIRSGSWLDAIPMVTSAGRSKEGYRDSAYFLGFRVEKSLD